MHRDIHFFFKDEINNDLLPKHWMNSICFLNACQNSPVRPFRPSIWGISLERVKIFFLYI